MKKVTMKIALVALTALTVSSCQKNVEKPVRASTSASMQFEHCSGSATAASGTLQHKTTAGGNFVAIGPNPGTGTPYFHGVSGGGFPLTPTPSLGGDNIIRNGATRRPLNNVTGIATDMSASTCFVLNESASSPGTWEVWKFAVGDPNNANMVFTISGGGTSLSDLEFDFNYSAVPGGTRFLALDRTNDALIEIDWSGTVVMSTGYYTSSFPLPTSEVVTGLAWFNCGPTGPWAHSHPFLLSHDASGTGHIWKCTDNTLENGWSTSGAEYTFGNNPSSPGAEFGMYFDHTATLRFVLANDALENTEAIPATGPGAAYSAPYAGSTDPIIDMAQL
ncbi:MAG: hypothetical protein V4649_01005 [Bacteroidota bacterium]